MTSRIRVAHLVGWIWMLSGGDGYGVPLFKGRGNAPLTPETDDDLTITRFHEFYNEAGHRVSGQLPEGHRGRRYRVGDKVPIPFSAGGEVGVADAGMPIEAFLDAYHRSLDSPAIKNVADILRAASSGAFRKSGVERAMRRFRNEHDEVLAGEPVHSSYWLQRLERAAANLRRMPEEYRAVEREIVTERAGAWLRRFSSKSDFQMLGRLLKVVENARFEPSQELQDQIFGAILVRLREQPRHATEQAKLLALTKRWMPNGLHKHCLEHGLPESLTGQDRERARNLPGFLWDVLQEDDRRRGTFDRSLSVAAALFADGDLPTGISEVVGSMALNRERSLQRATKTAYDKQGRPNIGSSLNPSEAADMLAENGRVVALYRILHGEHRLAHASESGRVRFGLPHHYIDFLRFTAKHGSGSDRSSPDQQRVPKRRDRKG